MTLVTINLLRIYRPIALWFLSIITVVMVALEGILRHFQVDGVWLLAAGSATKYWLLVVGILLSTLNLRTFVANGITRRDFTAGAGLFGLIVAVGLALFVLVGRLIERAALGESLPISLLAGEFARNLPALLAFGLGGWLIGAGYYRFHPLIGTALLPLALVPAGLTVWMLSVGDVAPRPTAPLPYWPALGVVLVAVGLGFLAVRWILGEVTIRRATG